MVQLTITYGGSTESTAAGLDASCRIAAHSVEYLMINHSGAQLAIKGEGYNGSATMANGASVSFSGSFS